MALSPEIYAIKLICIPNDDFFSYAFDFFSTLPNISIWGIFSRLSHGARRSDLDLTSATLPPPPTMFRVIIYQKKLPAFIREMFQKYKKLHFTSVASLMNRIYISIERHGNMFSSSNVEILAEVYFGQRISIHSQ